ncbi:unnamed protein product, partial [Tenebrio molitor]
GDGLIDRTIDPFLFFDRDTSSPPENSLICPSDCKTSSIRFC